MTAKDTDSRTIFHVATPSGRGAVSTIVIHGPSAMDCVNRLFQARSGQPIIAKHFGRIVYGHWIVNHQRGEDLVVCPRDDTWLEVHCHGGTTAAQLISETLSQTGAIAVGCRELAARISGSDYLAELTELIAKAPTTRTVKYLLAQTQLHRELWKNLLYVCETRDSAAAIALIEPFLALEGFGKHLVEPWSIVFCGAPNVGKSSLINSMLGFQRSIVHARAGTTRDVVEAPTALNGWPVRMFDTAGIRDTEDTIEQIGIDHAWQVIRAADCRILVIDPTTCKANDLRTQIEQSQPDLVIANKSDLVCNDDPLITPFIDLRVSAKTGMLIESLTNQISKWLVPRDPALSVPIPVTRRHVELTGTILNLVKQQNWRQAWANTSLVYETFPGSTIRSAISLE